MINKIIVYLCMCIWDIKIEYAFRSVTFDIFFNGRINYLFMQSPPAQTVTLGCINYWVI